MDDSFIITGFHTNKKEIQLRHYVAMGYPHNLTCDCMNSWNENENIADLIITPSISKALQHRVSNMISVANSQSDNVSSSPAYTMKSAFSTPLASK